MYELFMLRKTWPLAALLLGLAGRAAAQTTPADTTRLHYREETAPASRYLPGPALLRVQHEAAGTWKLGLNNFLYNTNENSTLYEARYGVHVAYERRLGPAWSALAELSPAVARYRSYTETQLGTSLSLRTQLAGRYYYNLERRLRRGRPIEKFTANYVSLVLGAQLVGPTRDTPFFTLRGTDRTPADVALVYGLQRRLGLRGFLDVNAGFTSQQNLIGSLRVGVLLGSAFTYQARPVPAADRASLTPRVYVGVQAGRFGYRVQYAGPNPYPANASRTVGGETQQTNYPRFAGPGYGAAARYDNAVPYLYAGYCFNPRLAVQVGGQRWQTHQAYYTTVSTAGQTLSIENGQFTETQLALPLLLRYALTPAFLGRWQLDALGGLTPVWSTMEFREYQLENQQATDQQVTSVRRTARGLHATFGLGIGYGLGRLRRVQAVAELMASKDLRTEWRVRSLDDLPAGASLGLRYRFGYR